MATEKRLIDANKPIRETESIINFRMCHHMPTEDYESFLNYLKKQPTVEAVEVVRGRWIVEDSDSGEHGCYEAYIICECSNCGQSHEVETGQFGWVYGEPFPFNYCPNCGADMRERKDND